MEVHPSCQSTFRRHLGSWNKVGKTTSQTGRWPPQAHLRRIFSHWSLVKTLKDLFWTRWSREYLNTLQQRTKWERSRPNVGIGDLVAIIDSSLLRANGQWLLGQIIKVHPGSDNKVRVATVRTATGSYLRSISKLALIASSQVLDKATSNPQEEND